MSLSATAAIARRSYTSEPTEKPVISALQIINPAGRKNASS